MTREPPLHRAVLLLLLGLLVGACAIRAPVADLAITGAWVHDGTGNEPVRASVVVVGGRFSTIGNSGRAKQTIDGRGLHLVPGLIDMHVHVAAVKGRTVAGEEFLSRGITSVRDLGGFPAQVRAAAAAPGGPRIRYALQTLNGTAMAPFQRAVTNEAEVRAAVDDLAASGAAVVKIHRAFPPQLVPPLVEAARSRGLGVTGHIPLGLHPLRACELGMNGIEHVGSFIEAYVSAIDGAKQEDAVSYMLGRDSEPLYRCLASRGVAVTPTLVLYESIARARAPTGPMPAEFARFIGQMQAIALRLQRSGVALMTGSDASGLDRPAVDPGSSLLRELELLRGAGLDGGEVIRAAAANPARSLGLSVDGRLIALGLAADFLILGSDPRADISAYSRPVSIYFAGQRAAKRH